MKKILVTLAVIVIAQFSYAQFNTSSGNTTTMDNVGIGTTSPSTQNGSVSKVLAISGADNIDITGVTTGTTNTGLLFETQFTGQSSGTTRGSQISLQRDPTSTLTALSTNINFLTTNAGALAERLRIDPSGNVGIGTTGPSAKLEISGTTGQNTLRITNTVDGGQTIGDPIGKIEFYTTDADGPHIGASMTAINEETFGRNTGLAFGTQVISGSVTERMRIDNAGNVGIGTTAPDAKLSVNGTIHTKEVKVDLTGWPDYVFNPIYKLPSLAAVKTYIANNHHLPGMPSAQEVNRNGINLGEMNKQLVKKVEELTLYLIEQQKQMEQLKQAQGDRIAALERALAKLTNNK